MLNKCGGKIGCGNNTSCGGAKVHTNFAHAALSATGTAAEPGFTADQDNMATLCHNARCETAQTLRSTHMKRVTLKIALVKANDNR
jgi:hypothetical protein